VNFGFSSDVRLGSRVCHVQTEEHGPARPMIDTVIYLGGRVLHRHCSSYEDVIGRPGFTEEVLRRRIEDQHRAVIEQLRAGSIAVDLGEETAASASAPAGLQVQLLNPGSWLAGGTAALEIEVSARADRGPLDGARLEVILDSTGGPIRFTGKTDERGLARISFPLPNLGPGGAELIIRAAAQDGEDEVRYALRPKAKSGAPRS
jgi:hypothetical protein